VIAVDREALEFVPKAAEESREMIPWIAEGERASEYKTRPKP
jgi:hypothetical protein